MNIRTKSYLSLASAMMIVGSSVVAGKVITGMFPVFLATGLSLLVAVIVLVPILFWKYGWPKLTKKDYFILFAQAFFGIVIFRVLLLFGLRMIDPGRAGIITSITPAIIGIISYLFLREKINGRKGLGIAVTVFGILLMQTIGSGGQSKNILLGSLLVFGSVVGEALFSVLAKFLSEQAQPFIVATAVAVFALLLTLPFGIYQSIGFHFGQISFTGWLAILYYGLFLTVLTFFLWFYGLKQVDASTAGVFTGLIPISSVGLSYLLLGQPITWSHIAGGVFVLLGIFLIAKKPGKYNQDNN